MPCRARAAAGILPAPAEVIAPRSPAGRAHQEATMHRAVELFAFIQLLVVGLSHLLQPRAWVKFFMTLHAHGHAGVLVHGFLSLWFGSIILGFHQVWHGVPAVLTVTGC